VKNKVIWALIMAMAFALSLSAAGCGKKTIPSDGQQQMSAEEKARLSAEQERQRRLREAQLRENSARSGESKMREMFVNQDIQFSYDSYEIIPEAKRVLNDKARFMQAHPGLKIIIEGHCDERGSNAYNLALGEKRSKAAAAYLVAMGIEGVRIETVSYGEERPIDMRASEEAYARNRRAHFVIK